MYSQNPAREPHHETLESYPYTHKEFLRNHFNMVFLLTNISLRNALSLQPFPNTIWCEFLNSVGRDSSVGIATCYVLNGPGTNPCGDEIFRTHPDRRWGPPSLLYNWYRVSFPGAKWPERGVDHSPLSCAEVKERVELYLYPPLWAIMACSGVNFTLFLNCPTRLPVHIRIIHIYLMIIIVEFLQI